MASIRTRFFGEVEHSEEDITVFPGGIPPFVGSTRFILLANEQKRPLLFLQSIDDETLCFITIPLRIIHANYELAVEPHDLEMLKWNAGRQPTLHDVVCLAILTVPEDGCVTANLLAPVLINTAARVGVQAVRADTLYTHAQPLDDGIHGGPAC